ncbi:MAG: TetR/AcrR family transcriptional regulator [Syntrophomonadaceae bacterium]
MTNKEPRDKRINDIVEAAVQEFLENGFEKTSMEAIARRAGLTKGGLYHHFRNKDEVLLQANRFLLDPIKNIMHNASSFERASDSLCFYIKHYLSYLVARPRNLLFFFLSMTKVLESPELGEMYSDYVNEYTIFFERLYLKGEQDGELIVHDAKSQALTLVSALDGCLWYLAVGDRFNLEQTIESFCWSFVNILLVKEKGEN